MSLETWVAYCLTDLVLCLTPGPAVLCVVSIALSRGFRGGVMAAGGVLAGNTMYFLLSATGVTAVILASSALFEALRIAGASYLIWIGLRMLVRPRTAPLAAAARPERDAFVRGFVVQGSNPKALLFFVALVPQFVEPAGSVVTQVAILGVTGVSIELVVLTVYVTLAVRARRLAGARLAGSLERVGGALLLAAGARLALARSR